MEMVDTQALRGIVSYEPSELVVTVGAGTTLSELEAVLAERGQCLAFEPPHYPWSGATAQASTVGGMVACGYSGPARASVGGVRDYVLGVQMVNGLGQHLNFGGQVIKNVAGYDVSRLLVGSWGTLGLITQVSLKVLPIAPAQASLAFHLNQADALEHLHRWAGQPLPLNASLWHDHAGHPTLWVRLRGAAAAVETACQRMLREVPGQRLNPESDSNPVTPDPHPLALHWAHCRNQQLAFFQTKHTAQPPLHLWRLSLPATTPALDLAWPQLVEWHGAQRWLWAPLQAQSQLDNLARSLGGHAQLFTPAQGSHGLGAVLGTSPNAAHASISQRLRASFDPHGIFNPHLHPAA
jgi:glycolate oxidase FAD binding subunit